MLLAWGRYHRRGGGRGHGVAVAVHVLGAGVLGYGRGVGWLGGVAMADLMGERRLRHLLGRWRHLHGHVVRLLRHLRVLHDLRVGGVRVGHL